MHKNEIEESFHGGGKRDNEDCGNMGHAACISDLARHHSSVLINFQAESKTTDK